MCINTRALLLPDALPEQIFLQQEHHHEHTLQVVHAHLVHAGDAAVVEPRVPGRAHQTVLVSDALLPLLPLQILR